MKKRIVVMVCCVAMTMVATCAMAKDSKKAVKPKSVEAGHKVTPALDAKAELREFLSKNFPDVPVQSITDAPLKGFLEVASNDNVFYYSPESEMFVFGSIRTKDGKDLTNDKRNVLRNKRIAEVMKTLPLDKAIKIGNGKKVILEFTDPDCPYCRNASKFLKNIPDVTRYVFFVPLAHPKAIVKAQYVLAAQDKAVAYEEVMEGKKDNEQIKVTDENAIKLANEHLAIGKTQVGISATPSFVVNGKMIVGANLDAINEALGLKK